MNLRQSRLRNGRVSEEVNPMEGVANLADLMLVLACGLMLSLVISWNVDIGGAAVDVTQGAEVQAMESAGDDGTGGALDEGNFERMGTVYRDPATGKLYMMTDE